MPLIDKSNIVFSLNADSQHLTPTHEWAERFCAVWEEFPEIFPEKVGKVDQYWMDITERKVLIEKIIHDEYFGPDVKKRKDFKFEGGFYHIAKFGKVPPPFRRYEFTCAISKKTPTFNWIKALSKLGKVFETDVGYVHRTTDFEIHKRYMDNDPLMRFYMGLGLHSYRDPFPELGWGCYFSERFCRRYFGEDGEKILNLKSGDFGCYAAKKDGFGVILQLTEKMEDVEADYATFNAIRDRLKEYIGKHYFIDNTKPYTEVNLNPNAPKMVCVVVDTEEYKTPQSRVEYFKDVITAWWKKEKDERK